MTHKPSMPTGKISKKRLVRDLKKIGVKKGDHIGVALSFKSIGYVIGGPNAFIDALLEAVGYQGTIMMPTYTYVFHASKVAAGKVDYIFDHRITPAWTGLVPETLRRRKGSIRSRHPVSSVTAIGRFARYLTEGHDNHERSFLPYSRLASINGKVLCIGIEDRVVAIRHEAQYLAGLMNVMPPSVSVKYRGEDGRIRTFVTRYIGGCTTQLPKFVPTLRKMGILINGHIGMARSLLVPAKEYLQVTSYLLKKKPVLNLCGDISCLWCRELERRMNLYQKIDNPRFFQKYTLVIRIIRLVNWLRLKSYAASEVTFVGINVAWMIIQAIYEKWIPTKELVSLFSQWVKGRPDEDNHYPRVLTSDALFHS